jgi:hypothetical protein
VSRIHTRRRCPERQDCWHVCYRDVQVGTIAVRTGSSSAGRPRLSFESRGVLIYLRTRETPSEGGIEAGQVGGVIRASLGGTLGTNLDLWLPIDSGKVQFRPVNALLLTPCR